VTGALVQGTLFAPAVTVPDLPSYHVILASLSGGKDSQTMLRELHRHAAAAGVADRIVCVFADLGADEEWPGVPELVAAHAAHYGLRLITVAKRTGRGKDITGLLDYIEGHGKWPGPGARFCTSDFKRGPIRTVITALADEQRAGGAPEQVRVLSVMGIRGQESTDRRLMLPFRHLPAPVSTGRKHIDEWLPLHAWTEPEVWADIGASGVPYHWAYDLPDIGRLSCVGCVYANKAQLVMAARVFPRVFERMAAMEVRMGHTLKKDLSYADILALARAAGPAPAIEPGAALRRHGTILDRSA
jgi:3'-phosphoadenosine 5'-phosphosulfate sulfotransferase (PAPS reductase)/FAD synthetase